MKLEKPQPSLFSQVHEVNTQQKPRTLQEMKWLKDLAKGKPLIMCHLSFKQKEVHEKSDSHRDKENRRSQSGMRINGCVDCVHLRFAIATNSHCCASVPGLPCFTTIVKQDIFLPL
jgi:hypothetical protein